MIRIPPRSFSVSPDEIPPVQLNEAIVRNRLSSAGIAEDQRETIVHVLKQACHQYIIDRLGDEAGVTPHEAHKYLAEVRKTVKALYALLDESAGRAPRAVIQQIEASQLLPPGFAKTLRNDAAEFAIAATKASEKLGQVKHGGARADKKERQIRFARGFIALFKANKWPMGMSHNTLWHSFWVFASPPSKSPTRSPRTCSLRHREVKRPSRVLTSPSLL